MERIGVALVGVGAAALPHSKALIDLADRADVRWAVGRTEESTQAFAKEFPFPVTTSIDEALSDPAVRVVFVLTPPNTHTEIASAAFAAGKHVLCEKPLSVSVGKAETLISDARHAGRKLGVVLQHRLRPASTRLRDILRGNGLGTVEAASLDVPWWRPQSYFDHAGRGTLARDGGGVLLTQAIHAIDLFRHLLGTPQVVASQVRTTSIHRIETEDYVGALMLLPNGAAAHLTATTAAFPGRPEALQIIGTMGTAVLAGGSLQVSYHDGREVTVESEGKSGAGAAIMDFSHDAHRTLIADFFDSILDDRDPAVTGDDALETQIFIDSIIRADTTRELRSFRGYTESA